MAAEVRPALRLAWRLALSHHPLCDWFEADVVSRRVRVCSGCAVALPAFVVGAVATVLAGWPLREPIALALAGLVLGLPQAMTYVHRGGRAFRAAAKALGGLGLAWLLLGLLVAPLSYAVKATAVAGIGGAFLVLQLWRMRGIVATCRACPWRMDWDACPGMLGTAESPVPKGT